MYLGMTAKKKKTKDSIKEEAVKESPIVESRTSNASGLNARNITLTDDIENTKKS